MGPWLPEPLLIDEAGDPARKVEADETVSTAFLLVLETLGPVERAVFLLREVFGYSYAEVAAVVGRTETTCRQVLARARRRLAERRPRSTPPPEDRHRLAAAFFAALREGEVARLEEMLAADVVLYGDGGGVAPARTTPVRGATAVARFLLGLMRLADRLGMRLEPASVNGDPGAVQRGPGGELLGVTSLEVADGRVVAVHNQINPAKLAHLGPVGDLGALMRGEEAPSTLGTMTDRRARGRAWTSR